MSYRAQLDQRQTDFWRALLAPFPTSALSTTKRGGRDLTYIDSRTLANRLDSVCGPHGWKVRYRETKRGYKARMGILCPVEGDEWAWVFKEDGAGFEEMGATNKQTGEFEYDVDNDEKSAYTNAFRRVAQNAWGIARYLYGKGIPDFLDPDATPAQPSPRPQSPPHQAPPSGVNPDRKVEPTAQAAPVQSQASTATQAPPKKFDDFKLPKPGRGVFAWAKKMEEVFETTIVSGMIADGKRLGFGDMLTAWDQEQINQVCKGVIAHLRTLPTYDGQYGYDNNDGKGSGNAPPLPDRSEPKDQALSNGLSEARTQLSSSLQVLLTERFGRKPEVSELKAAVAEISPDVPNGQRHTGEVMASVGQCTDIDWLSNMTTHVVKLIQQAREAGQPKDDIPF